MISALAPNSTTAPAALLNAGDLSAHGAELLPGSANASALIAALLASGLQGDAIVTIARILPRQYVIAWLCACVRLDMASVAADTGLRSGLAAAERWLAEPHEEQRQQAAALIGDRDPATAGDWLAAAVAWTGGSLAPAGFTAVPPGEQLTANASQAALYLIAAQVPEKFGERLAQYVATGLQLFAAPAAQSKS